MLVSFDPSNLREVEAMARAGNVTMSVIGKVGGESLVVRKGLQPQATKCSGDAEGSAEENAIEIQVRDISRIYREACSWLEEED